MSRIEKLWTAFLEDELISDIPLSRIEACIMALIHQDKSYFVMPLISRAEKLIYEMYEAIYEGGGPTDYIPITRIERYYVAIINGEEAPDIQPLSRVEEILQMLVEKLTNKYTEVFGVSPAYELTVPPTAKSTAKLNMIGGKTVVFGQLSTIANVEYSWVSDNPNEREELSKRIGHKILLRYKSKIKTITKEGVAAKYGVIITTANNSLLSSMTDYTSAVAGCEALLETTFTVLSAPTHFYIYGVGNNADGAIGTADVTVQLYDLTEISASIGFAIETKEDFAKYFGSNVRPYSKSELINAEVQNVVSMGRNLYNYRGVEDIENITISSGDRIGYVFEVARDAVIWHNTTVAPAMSSNTNFNVYEIGDDNVVIGSPDLLFSTFNPNTYPLNGFISISGGKRYAIVQSSPRVTAETDNVFGGIEIQIEYGNSPTDYTPYRPPISYPLKSLVDKYFPDGMKSAGNVHDELDLKNGVAIQRVGSVDLGTLGRWNAYQRESDPFWYVVIPSWMKPPAAVAQMKRFISVCGVLHYSYYSNRQLRLSFKDGTILSDEPFGTFHYELGEPIITPITESFPLLQVEEGGTVTFEQDELHLEVPNETAFYVKLAEISIELNKLYKSLLAELEN